MHTACKSMLLSRGSAHQGRAHHCNSLNSGMSCTTAPSVSAHQDRPAAGAATCGTLGCLALECHHPHRRCRCCHCARCSCDCSDWHCPAARGHLRVHLHHPHCPTHCQLHPLLPMLHWGTRPKPPQCPSPQARHCSSHQCLPHCQLAGCCKTARQGRLRARRARRGWGC